MKKNNIKYLIFAIVLIGISLELNYKTFNLNTIYLYDRFDVTGAAKTIQRVMTIIILLISIICLAKSIQAREKGVDFLFNKCMIVIFIIYTILSLFIYIYLRNYEEKVAIKMKNDIKSYSKATQQNQLKKNKVKNKNSFESDFCNTILEGLAESEYMVNDEYYERKKEIIKQIDNSTSVERYVSMLFYNPSYNYYGSSISQEVKYYQTFSKCFLIGIVGTVFYLFNIRARDYNTNVFYKKDNIIN